MALLVIDNGSSFYKRLIRVLRLIEVPVVTYKKKKFKEESFNKFKGVIISGGYSTHKRLYYNIKLIKTAQVPILGICLGAEHLAQAYGSKIIRRARKVQGWTYIATTPFELVPDSRIRVYESHLRDIETLNKHELESLGKSEYSENEIIRHKTLPKFGFQFHPEKSSIDGVRLLVCFSRICGFNPNVAFLNVWERNSICPKCGEATVFKRNDLFWCIEGHSYGKSGTLRYFQ